MWIDIGGRVKHPQCRKVLLQGHVALESHGLVTQARLASTENSVKKLQRVVSLRFLSGKMQKGVFIGDTHNYTYVRRQTQMHNPPTYCTRITNGYNRQYHYTLNQHHSLNVCHSVLNAGISFNLELNSQKCK